MTFDRHEMERELIAAEAGLPSRAGQLLLRINALQGAMDHSFGGEHLLIHIDEDFTEIITEWNDDDQPDPQQAYHSADVGCWCQPIEIPSDETRTAREIMIDYFATTEEKSN